MYYKYILCECSVPGQTRSLTAKEDAIQFPDFFAEVPTLTLRDPLAAFLGVSKSGIITYSYADAVKLAGHSCPTVSGAYLMVRSGLTYLYGDELPERGGIEVYLREPREQGVTGAQTMRQPACADGIFSRPGNRR